MTAKELISKWIMFLLMIDESTWTSHNQLRKNGGNGNSRENTEPRKKLKIENQKNARSSDNLATTEIAMKVENEDEVAHVIVTDDNEDLETETVIAKENALDQEKDVDQGTPIEKDPLREIENVGDQGREDVPEIDGDK